VNWSRETNAIDAPMRVAPMTDMDLKHVLELERRAFRNPWGILAFENELACRQAYCYVLKTDPGEVIAYICFRLIANELHVLKIAVNEPYRRQGVARQLLCHCLDRMPAAVDFVFLEVRPSNTAALRLYQKLGFTVRGRRPGYYTDTEEDAIIMGKIFKGGSNECEDSD